MCGHINMATMGVVFDSEIASIFVVIRSLQVWHEVFIDVTLEYYKFYLFIP